MAHINVQLVGRYPKAREIYRSMSKFTLMGWVSLASIVTNHSGLELLLEFTLQKFVSDLEMPGIVMKGIANKIIINFILFSWTSKYKAFNLCIWPGMHNITYSLSLMMFRRHQTSLCFQFANYFQTSCWCRGGKTPMPIKLL